MQVVAREGLVRTALFVLASLTISTPATGLGIVKIADTNTVVTLTDGSTRQFNEFDFGPAINNSSAVAFLARTDDGAGGSEGGVFAWSSSGGVTAVADTTGVYSAFPVNFGQVAINGSGQVAFQAELDAGGEGIFRSDAGTVVTIADSTTFGDVSPFVDIMSNGTVAFGDDNSSNRTVFVRTGDGSTVVCEAGPSTSCAFDTTALFNFLTFPSVNDSGTVAFAGTLVGGGEAVATQVDGVVAETGDAVNSSTLEEFGQPTINNGGKLAFKALLAPPDGEGIFLADPATPSIAELVDSSTFTFLSNAVGLNSFDDTAFSSAQGIFTGPDLVDDKVIGIGDTLFGGTVNALGFLSTSFNDSGRIAFRYSLTSGETGIALAVPEPSTLGILLLAGTMLARKGRRNLRQ